MEKPHKFSMAPAIASPKGISVNFIALVYNICMAFENSPSLNDPEKPRTPFSRWLYLKRRSLLALVVVAGVLLLVVSGLAVGPALQAARPGGLDGCLQTPDGKPLVTTVTIGTFTRSTYADGCFFFASIAPGETQLVISTVPQAMLIPVKIEANKAVDLGTITVPQ